MKLLLFSDSHGTGKYLETMTEQALKEGGIDAVLFAGDGLRGLYGLETLGQVFAVRGNCDPADPYTPQELTLPFGRHRIYLSHGNLNRVKRTLDLLAKAAQERKADIAVYGHTHVQHFEMISRIIYINPGALWNGEYALLHLQDDMPPRAEFRRLV
jgi:hypothetical protein